MISSIVAQRLLRQMFTAIREGSYNRVDVVLRGSLTYRNCSYTIQILFQ